MTTPLRPRRIDSRAIVSALAVCRAVCPEAGLLLQEALDALESGPIQRRELREALEAARERIRQAGDALRTFRTLHPLVAPEHAAECMRLQDTLSRARAASATVRAAMRDAGLR